MICIVPCDRFLIFPLQSALISFISCRLREPVRALRSLLDCLLPVAIMDTFDSNEFFKQRPSISLPLPSELSSSSSSSSSSGSLISQLSLSSVGMDVIVRCITNQYCDYRAVIACSKVSKLFKAASRLSSPLLHRRASNDRLMEEESDPCVIYHIDRWRTGFPHARSVIVGGDEDYFGTQYGPKSEWNDENISMLSGIHTLIILTTNTNPFKLPSSFAHLSGSLRTLQCRWANACIRNKKVTNSIRKV